MTLCELLSRGSKGFAKAEKILRSHLCLNYYWGKALVSSVTLDMLQRKQSIKLPQGLSGWTSPVISVSRLAERFRGEVVIKAINHWPASRSFGVKLGFEGGFPCVTIGKLLELEVSRAPIFFPFLCKSFGEAIYSGD